jgi:hypothetical protein
MAEPRNIWGKEQSPTVTARCYLLVVGRFRDLESQLGAVQSSQLAFAPFRNGRLLDISAEGRAERMRALWCRAQRSELTWLGAGTWYNGPPVFLQARRCISIDIHRLYAATSQAVDAAIMVGPGGVKRAEL